MNRPPLIVRIFQRLIRLNPRLERLVTYRNPRQYWIRRGGDRYFEEQENVAERTVRSRFIAERIAELGIREMLEVGCGYGKQLRRLADTGIRMTGIDFSRPQLVKSREYLGDFRVPVAEGDASMLPFRDKAFEASFSSAVILHNEEPKARRILSEMIRVTRRFLIHNEDTNISFSRYGYDLSATYRGLGFEVLQSCRIPGSDAEEHTQFTIARLPDESTRIAPGEIRLVYR